MRNIKAIATFIIVAGLSLFSLSHFANAATLSFRQVDSNIYASGVITSLSYVNLYGYSYPSAGYNCNNYTASSSFRLNGFLLPGGTPLPDNTYVVFAEATTSASCASMPPFDPTILTDNGYFVVSGGVITAQGSYASLIASSTRVVSFTPLGGSLNATGTVSLGANWYTSASDWDSSVCYTWSVNFGSLISGYTDSNGNVLDSGSSNCITTATSYQSFSTSSVILQPGRYTFYFNMYKNTYSNPILGALIGGRSVLLSSSSSFYVGTSSFPQVVSGINQFQTRLDALMASSTYVLGSACNPVGGSFNVGDCLTNIFYPGDDVFAEDMLLIRETPPWGYVFRVYDLMSSTTVASIPVIDAVIPAGIPGTGAHLHLDANHALDYILNATTSQFLNISASSTQTLYDITSVYWNYFVYFCLGVYMIGRLTPLFHLKK